HRFYFQVVPSMLPTEVTGYGLLLTPMATTISETQEQFAARMNSKRKNDRKNGYPNLEAQIKGLLPTPQVFDAKGTFLKGKEYNGNNKHSEKLGQAIVRLLPTPTATSDPKGVCTRPNVKRQNDTLACSIHGLQGETGKTSQLNPRFVGEMMGFPVNWTELPFLNGETKASKDTATPSSPK